MGISAPASAWLLILVTAALMGPLVAQSGSGDDETRSTDEDSCTIDCHANATCTNSTCICDSGFTGDGVNCSSIIDLNDDDCDDCDENANCTTAQDDNKECVCNAGYTGNGTVCNEITSDDTNTTDSYTTASTVTDADLTATTDSSNNKNETTTIESTQEQTTTVASSATDTTSQPDVTSAADNTTAASENETTTVGGTDSATNATDVPDQTTTTIEATTASTPGIESATAASTDSDLTPASNATSSPETTTSSNDDRNLDLNTTDAETGNDTTTVTTAYVTTTVATINSTESTQSTADGVNNTVQPTDDTTTAVLVNATTETTSVSENATSADTASTMSTTSVANETATPTEGTAASTPGIDSTTAASTDSDITTASNATSSPEITTNSNEQRDLDLNATATAAASSATTLTPALNETTSATSTQTQAIDDVESTTTGQIVATSPHADTTTTQLTTASPVNAGTTDVTTTALESTAETTTSGSNDQRGLDVNTTATIALTETATTLGDTTVASTYAQTTIATTGASTQGSQTQSTSLAEITTVDSSTASLQTDLSTDTTTSVPQTTASSQADLGTTAAVPETNASSQADLSTTAGSQADLSTTATVPQTTVSSQPTTATETTTGSTDALTEKARSTLAVTSSTNADETTSSEIQSTTEATSQPTTTASLTTASAADSTTSENGDRNLQLTNSTAATSQAVTNTVAVSDITSVSIITTVGSTVTTSTQATGSTASNATTETTNVVHATSAGATSATVPSSTGIDSTTTSDSSIVTLNPDITSTVAATNAETTIGVQTTTIVDATAGVTPEATQSASYTSASTVSDVTTAASSTQTDSGALGTTVSTNSSPAESTSQDSTSQDPNRNIDPNANSTDPSSNTTGATDSATTTPATSPETPQVTTSILSTTTSSSGDSSSAAASTSSSTTVATTGTESTTQQSTAASSTTIATTISDRTTSAESTTPTTSPTTTAQPTTATDESTTASPETTTDVNECATDSANDCDVNANCSNTNGSYTCTCKTGYSGNGTTCSNIDECTAGADTCDINADCSDTDGSYTCLCKTGYTGDGIVCTDINECNDGSDNCHANAVCTNTDGTFSCSCKSGYTGDGVTCTDFDECTAGAHDCHSNADCQNVNGSFGCTCKSGFSGDGQNCKDINECGLSLHSCDVNADCSNSVGSYLCACKSGFTGDGRSCEDIDGCALAVDNCDENADCIDIVGSFTCSCKSGYSGDGVMCQDIDECADTESHDCTRSPAGVCKNLPGTYNCSCAVGYEGDGRNCLLIEIPKIVEVATNEETAQLEMVTSLRHLQYMMEILDVTGTVLQEIPYSDAENSLVLEVENLAPNTSYYARARVVELRNGFLVSADWSNQLMFQTEPGKTPCNIRSQQTFLEDYNNINSPSSLLIIEEMIVIITRFKVFVLRITFIVFYPGSVNAVVEIETDPASNETLDSSPIPDPKYSLTVVPKAIDPPPENVTVYNVTTSSFLIKWDPAADSASFQVKVDYVNVTLSRTTNETSMVVENLPSNTAIVTSVRTIVNDNGTYRFSNKSKEITFTTVAEGPKDLAVVVLNGDCLDVTFKAVATANEYYIQASSDGYSDTITVSSVDQVDGKFSKRIDKLKAETTYSFVVTANVGGRNSTKSTTSATTGPSTVGGVYIYNVTTSGFNVEFDGVTITPAIETTYAVQYTSSDGTKEESSAATDIFVPASNPISTEYNVTVAYRTIKLSTQTAITSSMIWKVNTVSETAVDFSWNPYKTATKYNITLNGAQHSEKDSTSAVLSGLTPGQKYTIEISTGGKSLFTLKQFTCPPAVTDMVCGPINSTCIEVNFTSTQTDFEVNLDGSLITDDVINDSNNKAVICALSSGSTYTVDITAVNSECKSSAVTTENCATDIDECSGSNNCDVNANCENTPGSYVCTCKDGYTGNGTSCTDYNECANDKDNCNINADCSNIVGSFVCSCKSGYTGSGTECADINECNFANNCTNNADCTNTNGSYSCACQTGYQGEGTDFCLEILAAPVKVSAFETEIIIQLQPKESFGSYEVKLYNSSGDLLSSKTITDVLTNFTGLTAGTTYRVTGRILTLADGSAVNASESDYLEITTQSAAVRLFVKFNDIVFNTSLLDRESTYFTTIEAEFKTRINNEIPGAYLTITVTGFYSGSTGAIIEAEKNSSSPLTIQNATFAGGEAGVATTSSATPPTISVGNILADGFGLSWTNVSDATLYSLEVVCNNVSARYNVECTAVTASNFSSNTRCSARVLAFVNQSGSPNPEITGYSNTVTVTTLAKVPDLDVSARGSSTIRVVFGFVSGASTYYIKLDGTIQVNVSSNEIVGNVFTKDLTNIVSGNTYSVSVVPVVDGVEGTAETRTVTLVSTVTGVLLYNVTADGMTIKYDSIVLLGNTPVIYVIKYNNGTEQTQETSSTDVHIPSSPIATAYNLSVAYKTASSAESDFSQVISSDVFKIASVTSTSVDLTWTEVQGGIYTISSTLSGSVPVTQESESTTFSNLQPGTSYEFKVQMYLPSTKENLLYFAVVQVTVPGAVQNLQCSPVSSTCFKIHWDSSSEVISSYSATVSPQVPADIAIDVNDTAREAQVCQAKTGKLYNGTVFARNEAGSGDAALKLNCYTELTAPTNIGISVINQTCVSVSWTSNSFENSFNTTLTSDSETLTKPATSSPATFCNLKSGTVYNATVSSTYEAGDSDFSAKVASQVTAPSAPTLSFQSATTSSISLTWTAVNAATMYYVRVTRLDSGSLQEVAMKKTAEASVTVTGLTAGTVYNFTAFAENSGGNSTEGTNLEQIMVPDVVSGVVADTENVQKNVVFNWAATQGAESYVITVINSSGTSIHTETVQALSWSGAVNHVSEGESYRFEIKAQTAEKTHRLTGEAAVYNFTIAPPTPNIAQVTSVTTTSFIVEWTSSAVTTLHEVEIVQYNGGTPMAENATSLSQSFSSLTPGTVYNVTVRSRNKGGWSLKSDVQLQITVPLSVTGLDVTKPVDQTAFTLTWNNVTGADSYDITITPESGSQQTKTTADITIQFTGLSAGTGVSVTIVAKTAASVYGTQQTSAEASLSLKTAPSDPGTPTESTKNATSISVTWSASNGADRYQLTIVNSSNHVLGVNNETTQLTTTFYNLVGGTCFTVKIQAFNEFGSSQEKDAEVCTKPEAPDFSILSVTPTSITVNWTAVNGAIVYSLKVANAAGGESIVVPNSPFTSPTTVTVDGLSSGTLYSLTMESVGRDKSDPLTKMQLTGPAPPDNLKCTPSNATCFSLSWDEVPTRINFTATINEATPAGINVDVDSSRQTAQVCQVVTGTLYNSSVYATNPAGDGEKSYVPGCSSVLPSPTGVKIAVDNQTCFNISWDGISTAQRYTVLVTNLNDATTMSEMSTSPSVIVCNLLPGTLYNASVLASYEAGNSLYSVDNAEQITAPATPKLELSVVTTTSIALKWAASATAARYFVQMNPTTPGTMQATSNIEYTFTGLTAGTVYSFVVYAENDGGNSTASEVLEQVTVPEQVNTLRVDTENVQLNLVFNWSAVTGASFYNITVTKDGAVIDVGSESGTTWSGVSGLNDGTMYNATIIAYTEQRSVVQSSSPYTISFQTAPATPAGIIIQAITMGSFEVSWTASPSTKEYEIILKNETDTVSTETIVDTRKLYSSLSTGVVYKVTIRARNDGGWSGTSAEKAQITVPAAVSGIDPTLPVQQTSFRISWMSVVGAASYNVTVSDGVTKKTENVRASSNYTIAQFESLKPGTNYSVTIVSLTSTVGVGIQQISTSNTFTLLTAPENATIPTALERGETTLTLKWASAFGAEYYEVTAKSGDFVKMLNTTTNTTTITDLPSGTCFTIDIVSVNTFGESSVITGDNICTKPSPPDFKVGDVTTTSISLNWQAIQGAVRYVIDVTQTSNGLDVSATEQYLTTTSVVVSKLSPGTNYTITMRTINLADNGPERSMIQITVPVAPSLTLTERTTTLLKIDWLAVTGAERYIVEYKKQADAVYMNTTTPNLFYRIENLESGTMYDIRISSENYAGSSQSTTAHSTVISSGPVFTISGITSSGFEISITDVKDRESFDILLSGTSAKTTTETSTMVAGLSSGQDYTVTVVVKYLLVGESSGNNAENITTLASKPENFAVFGNTNAQGILLSWDITQGAVLYSIMASDGTTNEMYNYTSSPATIPTVLGSVYNFTIQGVNKNGQLGDAAYLNGIEAASVKVFTFEFTLNSTYTFSSELRDSSSTAFTELSVTVVTFLGNLFTDVNGFVKMTVTEFLQGSVVARVAATVNSPSTSETDFINAFNGSSADKTLFNTTQPLTTNVNECLNIPSECHNNATCTDTDGSFKCDCKSGYNGDGFQCTDINECADGTNDCHAKANCENQPGSFQCVCQNGYAGSGTLCEDINECNTANVCGEANCTNNKGSYICNCLTGYQYNDADKTCNDIIECNSSPCSTDAKCTDTDGSYTCVCHGGYTGSGEVCADIDECLGFATCPANSNCSNTDGSYSCNCTEGYEKDSAGSACIDIDECKTSSPCPGFSECSNTEGSYDCTCTEGYTKNGSVCVDYNECLDNTTCGANQTCFNTVGSYTCACSTGFTGDPSTQCIDINECDSARCKVGTCENTVGSYYCNCPSGYVLDGDECVDKDECLNLNACSREATCNNTEGSFICQCKQGYTGSNDVCTDIDECDGSPCQTHFACNNTDGEYECYCPLGFNENGTNCTNDDECELGTASCPIDRLCEDTVGSYNCECRTGTTGTTCQASQSCLPCVDVNECKLNTHSCSENATCTNTYTSFTCECNMYYIGDGFNCIANITRLTVVQTITQYLYNESFSIARSKSISLQQLDIEVENEVNSLFPDFTFLKATYSSDDGTTITVTYVIETVRPLSLPIVIMDYYNTTARNSLFDSLPVLSDSCEGLNCGTGGYCYEYNGETNCLCTNGYQQTGSQSCSDVNECASSPCDQNAVCTNTNGSYSCACNTGYTGNGASCDDVDECITEPSVCPANATCVDTDGSYNCPCDAGFTESDDGNSCVDQCTGSYCQNGGTCVRSASGSTPTCQCPSSFTGARCQDSVNEDYRTLAIAFGVIGGVLLIALIVALIVYIVRRKKGGTDFPL